MKKFLIAVVALLLMAPVAAVAAGGTFTDDDDSIFESNIEWLAGAGVTKGCNPPTNDLFCPDDNVSRGQMAAFMQRFAQFLGAEDGKVTAADSADVADSATTAAMAADSDALDGISSEGFLQHGEIILRHSTSELTPNWLGGPTTITSFSAGNMVTGDGQVNINLTGPAMIGGIDYGLKSIEYCLESVTGGAAVTLVQVYAAPGIGTPGDDPTVRNADGCYTVEVNASGDNTYDVFMAFGGGGSLRIAGIQSTWVPASSLPSGTDPAATQQSAAGK